MVRKGKYAGLIVSCFNTRVGRASLKEHLAWGDEYAVGELHYGGGFIEATLSWVVVNPGADTGRRWRTIVMSICGNTGGKQECVKALELKEPGHARVKHRTPEVSELVVIHKSGYGIEKLAELIKDIPGYFLTKNPTIKLSRRFTPPLTARAPTKLRIQRTSRSAKQK